MYSGKKSFLWRKDVENIDRSSKRNLSAESTVSLEGCEVVVSIYVGISCLLTKKSKLFNTEVDMGGNRGECACE